MEHCALVLGKETLGELRWTREGEYFRLTARCPAAPGWIYRVVAQCGAEAHPLGVMLPREGMFCLDRRLRLRCEPTEALIDRTRPGEGHLAGLPLALSAFAPAEHSDLPEGVLRAWWQENEYLLCPLRWGRECALADWLSVVRAVESGGAWYAVLTRRAGEPWLPLPERDSFRTGAGV